MTEGTTHEAMYCPLLDWGLRDELLRVIGKSVI